MASCISMEGNGMKSEYFVSRFFGIKNANVIFIIMERILRTGDISSFKLLYGQFES